MDKRISEVTLNQLIYSKKRKVGSAEQKSTQFSNVLGQKLNDNKTIHFSKHANMRLTERNIILSQKDISKISEAMDIAEAKDIKNALIVTDKTVYIANIKSRTIITALESMKGRVFTNVDGVVNI